MNARLMGGLLGAWVIAGLSLTACNYTVGECYPRDRGDGTPDTGGVIISSGVGGFGDAPPKQPQDVTNPPPDCNIVSGGPCDDACLAGYQSAAAECGKLDGESQRRACQDGAYTSYRSCEGACQQRNDCLEACKEECDRDWGKCRDNCPKGDKSCLNECTQKYGRCLKECDKRCK